MIKERSWCQNLEEKAANQLTSRSCEAMNQVIKLGDVRQLRNVADCLKAKASLEMLKEICKKQKKFEIGI
jgi:hypothetical protein